MTARLIHFSKATRWLGVWLGSHLTLKEHHNVRLKKARVAQIRLTDHIGLSPEAAAIFGAELWWKGEEERATWATGTTFRNW